MFERRSFRPNRFMYIPLLLQRLRHGRFVGSSEARNPGRLLPIPADPPGNPFPDTVHVFVPFLFLSVTILPDSQALVWRHKRIAQKTMRMIYPHRLSILCASIAPFPALLAVCAAARPPTVLESAEAASPRLMAPIYACTGLTSRSRQAAPCMPVARRDRLINPSRLDSRYRLFACSTRGRRQSMNNAPPASSA